MATVIARTSKRPLRLALGALAALALLIGAAAAADAAIGHVRTQQTPLTVRSGPGTSFAAVGVVAKGARLEILCQAKGTRVAGPFGATSTWNKLGNGRWVSDAYTSSAETAPDCSSPAASARPAFDPASAGEPCSSNERRYPNGRLPRSALCPLLGRSGEALRPRAAAAFNALSAAYEKGHGRPLCVTDSYRSYDQQVAVKASRGKWAATPGHSDHGLGRAVDLCGGVERFDTAAHRWMLANAPRFGWEHPAWAREGGRLPEPWHWEFTA
ncbi:D-alanyl-D-alanine carboxypeptidase [Pedococcus dokdonensis]|uniref:D-alanyl-D-alanine carboxypeptidase n=1 Tax=Pedococcus dokdonensis TaxID=443156 RepID=A0A1H0TW75_9MICO|nr:D-alanyl-D-alanine carboxypeptidase family protein [Pedococcus dokdonensis]SDP58000.1 D-alanyl-D-alanine carboxypeptidase [Pedococcus dokdonensis]